MILTINGETFHIALDQGGHPWISAVPFWGLFGSIRFERWTF